MLMVLGGLHVKLSVGVVGSGDDASFGSSHSSPRPSLIHTTHSRWFRLVANLHLRVGGILSRVAASMNCIGGGFGGGVPKRGPLPGFDLLDDGVCLGWVPGG